MTKRINKRRRKMLKATAVGVSLMMAPSLAVNVYADDAVTANEQSAINNFVATEPADGVTTSLGNSTVSNTTSGYRFQVRTITYRLSSREQGRKGLHRIMI